MFDEANDANVYNNNKNYSNINIHMNNGIVHQVKSAGGTLGPRKFFNLINLLTPLVLPLVLSPPRRFPIKTIRNFTRELERKTPCQSSNSHAEVGKSRPE